MCKLIYLEKCTNKNKRWKGKEEKNGTYTHTHTCISHLKELCEHITVNVECFGQIVEEREIKKKRQRSPIQTVVELKNIPDERLKHQRANVCVYVCATDTISRKLFANFHHIYIHILCTYMCVSPTKRDISLGKWTQWILAFFICTNHSHGLIHDHKNYGFIDSKREKLSKSFLRVWMANEK